MTNNPDSPYEYSPYDPPRAVGGGSPPPHLYSGWAVLGMVLAGTLCVLGLMIVAAGVIFVIGLNNYGSNK